MIPLYTTEQFNSCKSRNTLPLKCEQCNETFYQTKHQIQCALRPTHIKTMDCCSSICSKIFKSKSIDTTCSNCQTLVTIKASELKKSKSGNAFCSKSCAATYNNTHKTTGNRRSKLEI
jgi:hypothetical protein